MLNRYFFVVILLLLSVSPIFTQFVQWQRTAGPVGGELQAVFGNSNSRVVAEVNDLLFTSYDTGSTWAPLILPRGSFNGSVDMKFLVSDEGDIYLVYPPPDSLWVYLHNSSGWKKVVNFGVGSPKHIVEGRPGSIFLFSKNTSDNNLYITKTTDRGNTWQNVYQNYWPYTSIVSVSANTDGVLAMLGVRSNYYPGVFVLLVSSNNGRSWWREPIDSGTVVKCMTVGKSGNIFINLNKKIYRMSSDGSNWIEVWPKNILNYEQPYDLIGGFNNTLLLSFKRDYSNGIAMFRSLDDGISWGSISVGSRDNNITLLGRAGNNLFAAKHNFSGMIISRDSGATWSDIERGLDGLKTTALAVTPSNHLLIGNYRDGIYRSTNQGQTYKKVTTNDSYYDVYSIKTILGHPEGGFFAVDGRRILFSELGGSWQKISDIYPLHLNYLSIVSNGVMFTVVFSGSNYYTVGKSMDNGITWNYEVSLPGPRSASPSAFLAIDSAMFYSFYNVEYGGWLWRSTNEGINWNKINKPSDNGYSCITVLKYCKHGILFAAISQVYTGTYDGSVLYYSSDKGVTWRTILSSGYFSRTITSFKSYDLVENNKGQLVFASTEGLVYSTDHGANWFYGSGTLNNEKVTVTSLAADSSGRWYAGTYEDGVYKINQLITDISEDNSTNPFDYKLHQNYPNPFNPTTTIKFSLPKSSEVSLVVYNLLGQKVAVLLNQEKLSSGEHQKQFQSHNLSSGIYFYKLITEDNILMRKMILLR
ncbi:MAG: T9SS type A sorting domain-containing protein [Patescibacteria group bacterium]